MHFFVIYKISSMNKQIGQWSDGAFFYPSILIQSTNIIGIVYYYIFLFDLQGSTLQMLTIQTLPLKYYAILFTSNVINILTAIIYDTVN